MTHVRIFVTIQEGATVRQLISEADAFEPALIAMRAMLAGATVAPLPAPARAAQPCSVHGPAADRRARCSCPYAHGGCE